MVPPRTIFLLAFAAILLRAGPASAGPSEDLAALMESRDETALRLFPTDAIARGDRRYLDRYEDPSFAVRLQQRRAGLAEDQARLKAIAYDDLPEKDRLSYDILSWTLEDDARGLSDAVAATMAYLPLDPYFGEHRAFAREIAWRGEYPFDRVADYDAFIARIEGFARWLDGAVTAMRDGMVRGITLPRGLTVPLARQARDLAGDADGFLMPVRRMPSSIGADDRRRIETAYRETVNTVLVPAYRRLADFLEADYLPAARQTIGLSAMPGGRDLYRYLAASQTTLMLAPEDVHAIGQRELTRIEAEMQALLGEIGFDGPPRAFAEALMADPRAVSLDGEALAAAFHRIDAHVRAKGGALFRTWPDAPLEFRARAPGAGRSRAAAEYAPPSPDGRRPGIVFADARDHPQLWFTLEALSLHEGVPGHHLQLASALENESLPAFRRFARYPAFVEGWATYAESLGAEIGLYTDTHQRFGALAFEAWRASRLVVDTGIHWFGWTGKDAKAFLLAHTALSDTEAEAEIDRYIALPGQALTYTIGGRTFRALREEAAEKLGDSFDIAQFHDVLLRGGAMPLPILEKTVDLWIEARLHAR